MDRKTSSTWDDTGSFRDMDAVQTDHQRTGFFHEVIGTSFRAAGHSVRSDNLVETTLFPREIGRQRRMSWLKTLIRLLRGDLVKEELKRSEDGINEARNVIKETRAVMNGEDNWMMNQRECKLSNEGKS